MGNFLRSLNLTAIAVAVAAFYVLPYLIFIFSGQIIVTLGSDDYVAISFFLLLTWWLLFGSLLAGYTVASIAKTIPLAHGVVVGSAGAAFMGFSGTSPLTIFWIVSVLSALLGSWCWRYRWVRASRSGG